MIPGALLFHDTGELGNRLVTFSYLLAFGREHQVPVANLCFWRYAHFFQQAGKLVERPQGAEPAHRGIQADGVGVAIAKTALGWPLLRPWRERFLFDGALVCSGRALLARVSGTAARWLLRTAPGLVPGGALRPENRWHHECSFLVPRALAAAPLMDPAILLRHTEAIRSLFTLQPEWATPVADYLAPLRRRYRRLVGVHLRRGDYATYRGGRWSFDDATFARAMHAARARHGPETGFVLATNAEWQPEPFAGLEIHRAPGHLILDMYALAGCDEILGPPSTFSGWASFMGQVPITFLEEPADATRIWTPRYY